MARSSKFLEPVTQEFTCEEAVRDTLMARHPGKKFPDVINIALMHLLAATTPKEVTEMLPGDYTPNPEFQKHLAVADKSRAEYYRGILERKATVEARRAAIAHLAGVRDVVFQEWDAVKSTEAVTHYKEDKSDPRIVAAMDALAAIPLVEAPTVGQVAEAERLLRQG